MRRIIFPILIFISQFFCNHINAQVVIQRCDLKTGWSGDNAFTIDYSDKKEGDGALKIEVQSGTSNWFEKSFSRTQTGITSSGYLSFWLYVSDASKLEGGQIEISSSRDSDNQEYNWPLNKNNVTDGWNHLQLQISAANISGGGANLDNINYFRIYQTVSGAVEAKIDFIRFSPSKEAPVWPLLDVPVVDNTSLDGKVMAGYQGWFAHPDDGSGLGWVHWGQSYEPFKSHIDMYPDMREYGLDEKYNTHYTLPDGSMAPLYSSYNRKTVVRHMKWVRDYNLDGVFLQRFISASNNEAQMNFKDTVTSHILEGCEKYGRVFAMMYDGIAGKVDAMKSDWKHLVDDLKVTESENYLHHNGLPLVSLWGYTVRDEATLDELNEMIEFFTNNPDPRYRASIKLGVRWNWYDQSAWQDAFKKVDVISPWFSGHTDYDKGQHWGDQNNVDYLPVVHSGFSWYNLTKNYETDHTSGALNKDPRDGGNFLWNEVNDVLKANAKSIYVAMFDEVDESTAIFKTSETRAQTPREGNWLTLDMDGYDLPSDWYLRVAGLAANVVRGYEDNKSELYSLPSPPEGVMTIRITDEKNNTNEGAMEFIFPDFPNESNIEISVDGGITFPYSTSDNVGSYTITDLNKGNYKVCVRHNSASSKVDMGEVYIGNVTDSLPGMASEPFPEDGATDVRVNTALGWTAGNYTISNYIYLGKNSSPDSITYQASNSYSVEDLEAYTTYYWKIVEGNGSGKTDGPVWSFTTGDANGLKNVVVIDYCDDVQGWKSSNTLTIDSNEKKEGFSSLSCVGGVTPRFVKNMDTPVNSLCNTEGYLDLWLYVSDVNKFDGGGQIEITSSGKPDNDEYSWNISNLNLVNGWNELHLPISEANKSGDPDLSAINFFRLYQNTGGEEIEFKVDYIRFSGLATHLNSPELAFNRDKNIKLFPNPSTGRCILQLVLDKSSVVHTSIIDMNGCELCFPVQNRQLEQGTHNLDLTLNNLKPGTYVVKISIEKQLVTKLLIVK